MHITARKFRIDTFESISMLMLVAVLQAFQKITFT